MTLKPLLACLLFCVCAPLYAQFDLTLMGKMHEDRTETFPERPYGEDDISYGLYADIFEGLGGWRLGAGFATDLESGADSVITPEIGLLGRDGIWEAGFSVLIDYVDAADEADWGDVYFQTQLGINIPVTSRLFLGAHAFFPFEDWDGFFDLDTGDLDYAITAGVRF